MQIFTKPIAHKKKGLYENEATMVWKYSFEGNAVECRMFDGYIGGGVSYDAHSYLLLSPAGSRTSELYKLRNDTGEMTKMAEFRGMGSLFVGSDDGVYVLRNEDMRLVFYSDTGESRVVYRF